MYCMHTTHHHHRNQHHTSQPFFLPNHQDYTDQRFPFFFYQDPALSRLSPVGGPALAAGTKVTVYGNGFVNTTLLTCRFGKRVVPGTRVIYLPTYIYTYISTQLIMLVPADALVYMSCSTSLSICTLYTQANTSLHQKSSASPRRITRVWKTVH